MFHPGTNDNLISVKINQIREIKKHFIQLLDELNLDFFTLGASLEININGDKRIHLQSELAHLKESIQNDFLKNIQDEIFTNMYQDSFNRYVKQKLASSAKKFVNTVSEQDAPPLGLGNSFCLMDTHLPGNPIVLISDGFTKLTGYAGHEIIMSNCRFLQGELTDFNALKRIYTAIENKEQVTELIVNYRKNGNPYWSLITLSPVFDSNKLCRFYIGGQVDVTVLLDTDSDVTDPLSIKFSPITTDSLSLSLARSLSIQNQKTLEESRKGSNIASRNLILKFLSIGRKKVKSKISGTKSEQVINIVSSEVEKETIPVRPSLRKSFSLPRNSTGQSNYNTSHKMQSRSQNDLRKDTPRSSQTLPPNGVKDSDETLKLDSSYSTVVVQSSLTDPPPGSTLQLFNSTYSKVNVPTRFFISNCQCLLLEKISGNIVYASHQCEGMIEKETGVKISFHGLNMMRDIIHSTSRYNVQACVDDGKAFSDVIKLNPELFGKMSIRLFLSPLKDAAGNIEGFIVVMSN